MQGFTPDGKAILFSSSRAVYSGRYSQLYTVDLEGNFPELLKIPHAVRGSYSPDGTQLAYNPLYDAFTEWKNYRGGTASTVSIFRFSDYSAQKIPQPEGRCNDVQPRWMGDSIYFRSDRNGEFNLFSFNVKTKALKQLTSYTDFPVLDLAACDGRLVYEQAGYLHLFDPKSGQSQRLTIGVPADLHEVRARYVKGFRYIRSVSLAFRVPRGSRVPRGNRDRACGEGRSPQPDEYARQSTSGHLPGLPTARASPTFRKSQASTLCTSGIRTARGKSGS